jgi:hypothetical protein
MPDLRMAAYFAAKPGWFEETGRLLVAIEPSSGRLLGALTSKIWPGSPACPTFLHISTQFVTQDRQRTSLLRRMWGLHFEKLDETGAAPSILVLKTCNPSAFNAMRVFSGIDGIALYPRLDGGAQDPELRDLAYRVAGIIAPGLPFHSGTGVIAGAGVPLDFYPALPLSGRPEVDTYFKARLTPADRLLCISVIRTETAKRKVLRAFGAQGRQTRS